MNIWLMNHHAKHMESEQAGRHYWFAKELKKRGHNPFIFVASMGDNKKIYNCKSFESNKTEIPFIIVKTCGFKKNGIDRVKDMFNFYFNLFSAAKWCINKYGKPDVIIASSVHPLTMVAGIKIGRRIGVPCICEVRDLWPEAIFAFGKAKEKSMLGRLLIAGEHWIYKNADAMIFTKEGDTNYLKEKHWTTKQGGDIDLEKCFYINNGVDVQEFEQRAITEIVDDDDLTDKQKFNVVYAGNIRPVNKVGNIIECAKIIKSNKNYNNIQFLIYGDGFEYEPLSRKVEEEGITNVKMKGYINKKHIPYILSKSSVNILNYAQDLYNWSRGNSSNKLFEYMASGKPVISTVKMGYSIIKRYHCGIELEECTAEALANAIIALYDSSDELIDSMGKNAKEGAKDFDFSILTDRLEKVISYVLINKENQ